LTLGGETLTNVDLHIARLMATDVHPVDSPVVDAQGNVYTTLSGPRGEQSPVSVFRIRPDGTKEAYLSDIMNPTSMAFGPDGALYISSRFNGTIYRVTSQTDMTVYAEGLGTATGIVFDSDGNLYIGDRTGTIYLVKPDHTVLPLFNITPSVAAFHLCLGPDGSLYITNPDISTYDCILRVPAGSKQPQVFYPGVKRPQGMAFDEAGNLYVAKAMAGDSGILRITPSGKAAMIVSGPVLVGLAFDAPGNMIVASTNAIYRLTMGIKGMPLALTSFLAPPKIKS
jgi:sugar lactone lactonase YvrE